LSDSFARTPAKPDVYATTSRLSVDTKFR